MSDGSREDIILETINLSKYFGGVKALQGVSIRIKRGLVTGIIGPNGAGKTTLFRTIAGFYKPTSGKILFEGREIQGKPPHRIALMGIALTFQVPKQFPELTVLENIVAALGARSYTGLRFTGRWDKREVLEEAARIAEKTGLGEYLYTQAKILPLGLQKRLEIARALALRPKLVMLDEPAAGMSAEEAEELKQLVAGLRREGITVLLVEHNVPFAVGLSDYMYVLHYGQVLAHGAPEKVIRDPKVVEAYLGAGYAAYATS